MGTVMKMKFVLAFICLVASVASMKDKHYLVETADKNGRSEKYQDGTDYSGGYGSSKSSEVEKYGSGKNISRIKIMGLVNMALIRNMNLERAMIIINMDTMTQENMILVNTDMESQVKRLNTTGENGRIGTTV